MIIIPGPASTELGKKIARELGLEPEPVGHRLFPDGESYIKLNSSVAGETVVLVQTTAPNPDTRYMQLLVMARTARDFGARHIIACVPYLAYMRQDKRFLDGEALSFDIVLGLLEDSGVDDLLVVDLHSEESLRKLQPNHRVRVHTLSAIPVIAKYLKENGFDGAYSLSPDEGRRDIVSAASEVMGGGFAFFEKNRDLRTGETTMFVKDVEVRGRKAVVFDDIISSGGTMAKAVKALKAQGAEKVAAACTHALFMGGAEEKIRDAGADLIVASDSVETPFSRVSVASAVAEILKGL